MLFVFLVHRNVCIGMKYLWKGKQCGELGGGAMGTAFMEAQCHQGILRNGETFSEIWGVRWS